MSELFIPQKIRVGFQHREGTYTGKLAYVIYYDAKGKLRKETSWAGWRDDKIKPQEFDNTPQDGFHLNKDIKRYNWSHFGSNRSYIRIFDARGIEFEITPENLIGLLTETTCSKRGLDGEFVYAWCGADLVLLPCSSEAYVKAVEYTARQNKKISAKDLKTGCSYTTKRGMQVIYMGRFPWFRWNAYQAKCRISQKRHIFARIPEWGGYGAKPTKYEFFPSDASFLAELDSEDPVQNYAKLIDKFNGDVHSSVIENFKTRPFSLRKGGAFERETTNDRLKRFSYTEIEGDNVIFWHLVTVRRSRWNGPICGYRLRQTGVLDTKKLIYKSSGSYCRYDRCEYTDDYHYHGGKDYYGNKPDPILSEKDVLDRLAKFVEVDAVLSSGKKLRMKNIESIAKD